MLRQKLSQLSFSASENDPWREMEKLAESCRHFARERCGNYFHIRNANTPFPDSECVPLSYARLPTDVNEFSERLPPKMCPKMIIYPIFFPPVSPCCFLRCCLASILLLLTFFENKIIIVISHSNDMQLMDEACVKLETKKTEIFHSLMHMEITDFR